MTEKRKVPTFLKQCLQIDEMITKRFVTWASNIAPFENIRNHYKALEISCHGIPWFAFWIAFTWLFNNPSYVQMQVNMLLGLFTDIVFIAIAKAYFRRRRPRSNKDDALGQMGPDVFSFPSGHASRAVFVAYFFINLMPVTFILSFSLIIWATAVCLSRVLMERHYILDVIGGVLLGLFNGIFLSILWIEDDTANWIMSYLSDEKLDGGEYHV